MTRSYHIVEPYSRPDDARTAATAALDTAVLQSTNYTSVRQTVQVKTAALTFDSTWQPYVQGTIVVVQPSSAVLALLDPRNGLMVRFTMRQIIDGVQTDQPYCLMLRSRSLDWQSGELTLTVASFDAQMPEYTPDTVIDQALGGEDMPTIVDGLTPLIWWPGASYGAIAAGGPTFTKADQVWQPGTSMSDYMGQFLDIASASFYIDELGNSWTVPLGYNAETGTHFINDARHVINIVDVINRDDPLWANWVVISYQGQVTTATGAAQLATAKGANTTLRKALTLTKPGKKPSTGNAATKVLNAAAKRGQALTITAVADIVARPNQNWSVAYGDTTHAGQLQNVTFNLPEGTMTMLLNATS